MSYRGKVWLILVLLCLLFWLGVASIVGVYFHF